MSARTVILSMWSWQAASLLVGLVLIGCEPTQTDTSARVMDGRRFDPLDSLDAKAKVLIFTRTDCPISNRYAPEVRRLCEAFSPQGVQFWLAYPNPDVSLETIQKHLDEYAYPCRAVHDPEHTLAQKSQANITPEAAVYDAEGKLVYRGRIDNWYADLGKSRPAPTIHDLEDALRSVLAGQPVANPTTEAVGCYISDLR